MGGEEQEEAIRQLAEAAIVCWRETSRQHLGQAPGEPTGYCLVKERYVEAVGVAIANMSTEQLDAIEGVTLKDTAQEEQCRCGHAKDKHDFSGCFYCKCMIYAQEEQGE